MGANHELQPFRPEWAGEILRWILTPEESKHWGSLHEIPCNPTIFAGWHSVPGTHPYLLFDRERPIAYGEIWCDSQAGEVELARLVVAPRRRKQGIGRRFVTLLLAEAARTGLPEAFVRVHPDNVAAIVCYQAAGFLHVTPDAGHLYNQNQPVAYLWLRKRLVA